MTRPSYNPGTGFYVGTDGKLYDPSGTQFIMRGVNRVHYDDAAAAGITKSRSTAERFTLYWANGTTAAEFVTQLYNECYSNGIVAIPGVWTTDAAYGPATVTCSVDTATLQHAVDEWVGQAATWNASYQGIPTERWMIINIANEWGPANSTTWRDAYISAISALRTAGYKHTLLVDTGSCGQDFDDLTNYAAAVFNSDPLKNVIFGIHLYGNLTNGANGNNGVTNITQANPAVVTYTGANTFANGNPVIITGTQGMTQVNSVDGSNILFTVANVNTVAKTFQLSGIDSTGYTAYSAPLSGTPNAVGLYSGQTYATTLLQSLVATGLTFVVGEFGPGRNIGPSPTMTWPGDVIRAAEALGVGWLAWGWDDNNLVGSASDDSSFALVYQNSTYNVPADLTIYGQDVLLNSTYGLQVANYRRADFTPSSGLVDTHDGEKIWHQKTYFEPSILRSALDILPAEASAELESIAEPQKTDSVYVPLEHRINVDELMERVELAYQVREAVKAADEEDIEMLLLGTP